MIALFSQTRRVGVALALFAVPAVGSALAAEPQPWGMGLQPAATPIHEQINDFHNLLLVIINSGVSINGLQMGNELAIVDTGSLTLANDSIGENSNCNSNPREVSKADAIALFAAALERG